MIFKRDFISIKPTSFPFYYGYMIIIVGTLGVWASLPGQTMGVSTFTDPVMEALNLTRDQFSWAYMIGTLLSSIILTRAGKFYDSHGATLTSGFAVALLGITLYLCSISDILTGWVYQMIGVSHWLIPFFIMSLLFFMLRFSGQGVLTMVSRNMMMKWFDRYRGRVNAISSVAISLGFSASPIIINWLIERYGWSGAWQMMAAFMVVILVVIILFYKDNPGKYGLTMDGLPHKSDATQTKKIVQADFTLEEATRTRAFWMYALMLSFYAFFVTGLTFHVVSIFGDAGYSRSQAIAIFVPLSIISVITSVIANFISDWINIKILLFTMIAGAFLSSIGLLGLNAGWGIFLIILGGGIMGGLFTALMAITWPRFFGYKHLGAISGKAMSMLVMASALGPVLFSMSNTWLKSYGGVSWISLAFLIVLAVGSLKANPPEKI